MNAPQNVASAPNPALNANLSQLLKLDLQNSTRLAEVLTQERETLQQRDRSALAGLIEEKEQLLAKLNKSALLRSQWLGQLGLPATPASWQNLIDQQQDGTLSALWVDLDNKVKECRELNEVNGRLIGRSQQTLNKLLNILRGNKGSTQLYGRNGNAQTQNESRCFTEA